MPANKKLVAAKYRAVPLEDGGFGVAMFVFDDETGRHDDYGSIISGVRMTHEKAVASAARWQAKENKAVAKENKDASF